MQMLSLANHYATGLTRVALYSFCALPCMQIIGPTANIRHVVVSYSTVTFLPQRARKEPVLELLGQCMGQALKRCFGACVNAPALRCPPDART